MRISNTDRHSYGKLAIRSDKWSLDGPEIGLPRHVKLPNGSILFSGQGLPGKDHSPAQVVFESMVHSMVISACEASS